MSWHEVRLSLKRHMHEDVDEEGNTIYVDPVGGAMMQRETITRYGETYTDVWVLRDGFKEVVDFDQYRFDMEARNDLRLVLKTS